MKRFISILVTAAIIVTLLAGMTFSSSAAQYSGTCGNSVSWNLNTSTGVLLISGGGEMSDFSYSTVPWRLYTQYITSVTIMSGVATIGDCAFFSCSLITDITIPNTVQSIGKEAFYGCGEIKKIELPTTVTNIGEGAFRGCSKLEEMVIPANVKAINNFTFFECVKLKSINIPEGVSYIGTNAFDSCKVLTSITIPQAVNSIEASAFENCSNLEKIIIPNTVTTIGAYAFSNCYSLTDINIPQGVTTIEQHAFSGCHSLESINIPNTVKTIGIYAFNNCIALKSIDIPNGVASIAMFTFQYCTALTNVNIPNSVTNIERRAFYNCTSLANVNIPNSITSIGIQAFYNCNNLTTVNYHGSESNWTEIIIGSSNEPLLNATRNYIYGSETFNSASVRISSDHPGLRFKTAIEQDVLDELIELYGKENIKIGTIIIPEDMVTELDMVTVEALEAAGINCVRVLADIDKPFTTNGTTNIYAGSLTNIKEANLDRDFIGVGYIEITKSNGEVLYYYSSTTATRNVSYIASRAIGDTSETQANEYKYEILVDNKVCYSPYTESQREILDKLIVKE